MSQLVYAIAAALAGFAVAAVIFRPPPPPAVTTDGRVVRVLDVTIRDSNTTGRRQRFECLPVAKGETR